METSRYELCNGSSLDANLCTAYEAKSFPRLDWIKVKRSAILVCGKLSKYNLGPSLPSDPDPEFRTEYLSRLPRKSSRAIAGRRGQSRERKTISIVGEGALTHQTRRMSAEHV